MIPFPAKIDFKPGRKLIFGAIGLVALIGIIMIMFSNGETEPDSIDTGKMQTISNTVAGLKVEVPEGWQVLNSGEYISIESPDKKINVDYTRDPSLNKKKVYELLSQGGGQVSKNVDKQTVGGKTAEVYQGSANSLRRLATLRKGEGAPVLAFLEIAEKDLKAMDRDRLGKLLIANVDTIGNGPEPVATPVPKETPIPKAPATASPQTSQQIDSAALPTPVAKTDSTLPATATPEPSAATQVAATDTPGSGPTIKSKSLSLTLTAPDKSWTGSSEEADAMLTLADDKGLEVRIARDSSQLDADATFKAMEEEKWKKDGDKITPEFQAGEFARDDQNLILVLIPEKAKTTIVIYATSSKDFNSSQRHGITNIINQILAAQK